MTDTANNVVSGVSGADVPLGNISRFSGYKTVQVDDQTYQKCIQGKVPFERWSNYVDDQELMNTLKKHYKASKRLLVKNAVSGAMAFIK